MTSYHILVQSTLTNSEEVAIVISINACKADGTCTDPADDLGTTLYNGPYHPQRFSGENEPYQNFTVEIPSSLAGDKALLSVVHLALAGVSYEQLSRTQDTENRADRAVPSLSDCERYCRCLQRIAVARVNRVTA